MSIHPIRPGAGPTTPAAPGIGAALRELRQRRRLSQARLGAAIGVHHAHISRLESGDRLPSRDTARGIADALHLNPAERDGWLRTCGYAPVEAVDAFAGEPELMEAWALLRDESVPALDKENVRQMLRGVVWQARRAAESMKGQVAA